MNEEQYKMIFKRKSFHLFRDTGEKKISAEELSNIEKQYKTFKPLMENIRTDIRIVPASFSSCNRGEEYCIYLYSEEKENYLQNIGYLGEQLDLYLTSLNIGTLWFGIGKTEENEYNGLSFVIMMAIKKVPVDKFRKDMFKSKRKDINEMWLNENYQDIANIVRFAPSSCNTQPWIVEGNNKKLEIYRYKKPGKRGIMPVDKVNFYNRIDMGIFLLFLDIVLENDDIKYKKEIYNDTKGNDEDEKTLFATYYIL